MISIKNIPIVIEPGVNVLEAEFFVRRNNRHCSFPIQLFRISADKKTYKNLPFVPSVKTPHVFGLSEKPSDSLLLVVYSNMGSVHSLYTRQHLKDAWEKEHIADEYAGRTITKFSVRYVFNSHKNRAEFMSLIDRLISQINNDQLVDPRDVVAAFTLLSQARTSPVPVSVAALRETPAG
jgi:hypothetical protein